MRQIEFNAWHYVEANLWASLATHIFDSLAAVTTDAELKRLETIRESEHSLLAQLSAVRVQRRLVAARGTPVRLSGDDLAWVAQEVGVPTATTDDVLTFARRVRGIGKFRLLARSVWTWIAVVLGAGLGVGLYFLMETAVWPAVLGTVPVLVAAGRVLARAERIRQEAVSGTDQRLAELDAEADRLTKAVTELAPAHDITAFARTRDYREHLGVVSMLRRDLETFAKLLAADASGPERVVLYIDDLDRCPPDVVIKVLEAVHLLVALPVFVVVVGVDPRWLHQAIRYHYSTVLPDAAITSTDYLEKIFQIPFQLSPMDGPGFSGLVQELAGGDDEPAPVPTDDEMESAATGPLPKVDHVLVPATRGMRPRRLTITQPEVDFLAQLAPMVASPRAAKRLTNLYRLVRARLSGPQLDTFLASDQFRAVLVLLATGGSPRDGYTIDPSIYDEWLPLVRRFSFGHEDRPPASAEGRSENSTD